MFVWITMITCKNISDILDELSAMPVVDVRSPREFLQGHIPGAVNIPLFDDHEREKVGRMYAASGKEASLMTGLDIAGPKLAGFVKKAKVVCPDGKMIIHCWRGGMRSASIAWLFDLAGMDVSIINGGYKAYRRFIRESFSKPAYYIILGGKTGTGKTDILHRLSDLSEQILDIEGIANHKGSAFGHFGQQQQPVNEQFENNMFDAWRHLNLSRPIWLEDESRSVGVDVIPDPLFSQMIRSPLINLHLDKEKRINRLVEEYAGFDKHQLCNAVNSISRRLGSEQAAEANRAIENDDFRTATSILLTWYDKAYQHSIDTRQEQPVFDLHLNNSDAAQNAREVLDFFHQNNMFKTVAKYE